MSGRLHAAAIRWAIRDRRVLVDEVLAQHHELVAAEPGDRVTGRSGGAQSRRQLAQQQVADVVPAGVVDELEVIEIEEQHRDPGSGPAGRGRARARAGPGTSDRFGRPVSGSWLAWWTSSSAASLRSVTSLTATSVSQPLHGLRLADGSLDGELGAVLAPGDQVELAPAHRLAVPRLRPGSTEQHVIDADARQLSRGVAEEVLGLRVGEHDPTRGVERHECARRALEQGTEAVFVNAGGGRARSAAQAQLGGGRVQRGI